MRIAIRQIDSGEFECDIFRISKQAFGEGYVNELLDPAFRWINLGAFIQEQLVGFLFLKVVTNGSLDHLSGVPESSGEPLLVFNTIAVDAFWQRNGVGTMLLNQAMQIASNECINRGLFIAWINLEGVVLHSVLTRLGFVRDKRIERYWFEDSLKKKYGCVKCGLPPCLCDAVVYLLHLNNAIN